MNRIIFPLRPNMQGFAVADLQEALRLCLEKGIILPDDPAARQQLVSDLQPERAGQVYHTATRKLVGLFQDARHLQSSGEVDEATANALNALLKEWRLLDLPIEPAQRSSLVSGQVRREDGRPLRELRVRAVHEAPAGPIRLGEATTDTEGRYTLRYELLPGVDSIDLRVVVIEEDGRTQHSSQVVSNAQPIEIVDVIVPLAPVPVKQRRIEGRIMLQHGLPAGELKVRLYRLDFGGTATQLAETSTLAGGQYAFTYDPSSKAVSLQVRVVGNANEEIPLTKPLNDLSGESVTTLNLVAPSTLQPLAAEYRRLSSDLAPHVGQMAKLADIKEDSDRQDLTVLNRLTGWDARLIALAATTERLKADVDVSLPPEPVYGLLRSGLPSDPLLLAQIEPDVAEQALKTVRDAGIVELNDQQITDFKNQFATFATKVRLKVPVPGSRATYGALLKLSGLSESEQARFAQVYLRHNGDASQLWKKTREEAGLTDAQVGQLQLQGKLAFLAGNSEGMTARLMQKAIADPVQLVEQDFHRADSWIAEIFEQAGIPLDRRDNLTDDDKKSLEPLIPIAYAGGIKGRLQSYAEDMARKVRLGYPTQLVGRMIEKDEIDLLESRDATVTLMKSAAQKGFRLGETPVEAFLKTHAGLRQGMTDPEFNAAQRQMKTLQRVYQITPNNEAMPVLLGLKMSSAYDVTAYSEPAFVELFNAKYLALHKKPPTADLGTKVYHKARQVSSVTYNLFTIARKLDNEPQIAGMSAPEAVRESVRNELIKQFPTMESLFGSMDFCECEHCRSVLSPAAYLVDLLQFIDPEPEMWGNFPAQWKTTHGGQDYPHKDANGKALTPYDVLISRRPDLPHIPLTCENTLTALPYIDVVNEIMEYFVANGKLEKEAAHDTGEASTAELLAEPQNVIREAYDNLRQARYPLTLPFDLWIETVRQFCNYFETPLARVLEALRPNDDLFAPDQPFDRAAIFMESLGLSSAETSLFTDADPLGNDRWHELYGLPTTRSAIQNPTNAGHATLSVATADAGIFREGLAYTYFDVSANALSAESMPLSAVGAPDSGGVGQSLLTFSDVWTLPPEAGDLLVCHASVTLSSAKTLSRRLGVTYKEIMEIVQTGFVNPKLSELSLLYKLGVKIQDARLDKEYRQLFLQNKDLIGKDRSSLTAAEQQRFDHLSTPVPNTPQTGWEIINEVAAFESRLEELASAFNRPLSELQAHIDGISFGNIIVLADPDAGCDFDLTTLRYANGDPADAIVFLRINLFVRLWRKLGWSIEETDGALRAFLPRNAPFEAGVLYKQPFKTALIYLAHLKALDEKVRVGKQSRLKLIALWSDLGITGKNPLYAQLFLTRSVLRSGEIEVIVNGERQRYSVFDDSLGKYLSAPEVKVRDHVLALQGALGLTADDISRILVDAELPFETAALSVSNVSLLYRYGLMAKALKLSLRELIALKQLSGLDPFKLLHVDPLTTIENDYPFTQTLRFVQIAEEVKDSGLTIEDLEYLLRHRFDETGKYRPNRDATMALLKMLSEGIRAIRIEHAMPDDPGTMSEGVLRQKLGLVLPSEVAERFLAMMNGTAEFTATKTGIKLEPAAFAEEPSIRQLSYNDPRQEQKLTFRGVLFDLQKDLLKATLPKPVPPNSHVPSPILSELLDDVQEQARAFFARYLQTQAPNVQPTGGFIDAADYSLLFDPRLPLAPGETEQDRIRNRRTRLARAFMPFLQQRLIRQLIVQTMTAHTGANPVLVESLLTDKRLLAGPEPLVEAFSAIGERGVNAHFFDSVDGSGVPQPTRASVTAADTALKEKVDANGIPLTSANSARFEGYLEVPTPGPYRFYVALDKQNAGAELRFDHLSQPVVFKGNAIRDNDELGKGDNEFVELKAGIPYRFTLKLWNLNGGGARLLVQGETVPKGSISQLTLYPLNAIAEAERAVLLLTKALQLLQTLTLSEREVRHLLIHREDFDGIDLSQLPTRSSDDTPARAEALFKQFLRLAAYTRLKRDVAGGTDDLIQIFEGNAAAKTDSTIFEQKIYPLIARLTRRDEALVEAGAQALFTAPAFASEQPLRKLWEVLQVVERFGVPVASLANWTRIASPAVAPDERFGIACDVKDAIKARFEPETWRRVAQPIFDKLRQRQRDGLVAFITHQLGFARMEQLYEYFLIDPGMEPVVQTSRIRLAIGSLQLFVQRCLLNLELHVHPSLINSKHWEWMKRYRVWEANRKIFLFPENWLEPEFRDDKTHLFAELEGALLQGDVSSDLVEDAFLNYLKKLEELARLDMVAMHIEDNAEPTRRTLHVIGRTYSVPHKYFYRRYVDQMWTPWEPVSAEVEGDHLAPVVWRDRLYLFWVTFMEKADPESKPVRTSEEQPVVNLRISEVVEKMSATIAKKIIEVQLHWSEYLQGEWNTRESSGFDFVVSTTVPRSFQPSSVPIHVAKEPYENGEERGVYINLGGLIKRAFYLAGRNSTPESTNSDPTPRNHYVSATRRGNRYAGNGDLQVRIIELGGGIYNPSQSILEQGASYTLLPCDNNLTALAVSEDAYADADNPAAVKAAIEGNLKEVASLMKPVFYQDNAHTFLVEPSVTERTIEDWQEWVTRTPQPEPEWQRPDWGKHSRFVPGIPWTALTASPADAERFATDPRSLLIPKPDKDWLLNPGTGLLFDGVLIGPGGRAGLDILPAGATLEGSSQVNVNPGSDLPSGSILALTGATNLKRNGLAQGTGGLNIVGSAGFNSSLAKNFDELNSAGFEEARLAAASHVEQWRTL